MSNSGASFPAGPPSEPPSEPPGATAVSRQEVSFVSGGQWCDGSLYQPTRPGQPGGAGAHPGVVMAHGIGGIRSAVLPAIAERFAAAGVAALVFDYRHSGTSQGWPRGLIDIAKQREDYRAAIAHLRQRDGIDPRRIALWGTSFSGGHVLSLAAQAGAGSTVSSGGRDSGIAAAVIQNPFVDGRASVAAIRSAGPVRAVRLVGKVYATKPARSWGESRIASRWPGLRARWP